MRRSIAALAATAVLFLAIAPAISPGARASAPTLTVYGDVNFSPAATAHAFVFQNAPDLSKVLYGNGNQGDCPSQWWRYHDTNTWYDCISSFRIANAGCHYGVVFYYSPNYVNPIVYAWGDGSWATIPNGWNDDFYSFQWMYRSICPANATSGG
jgi:hypothetical protein